jgi:streptomycin 6-kinase
VRCDGQPVMVKIVHEPEERFGAGLMLWWDGDGAARVLAHEGDALLMERAVQRTRLTLTMVPSGNSPDS